MKVSKMKFACVCLVCLTVVWSLPANAAVTELEGTFQINLHMTVTTAVPVGGTVTCSATVTETGDANGSYFETASAVATNTSGESWTCPLTIHYAWFLSNPTADSIIISYSADIFTVFTVGGQTKIVSIRNTTFTGSPTTGVPAAGVTTTNTFFPKL